jgi:hypothetical protein
MERVLEFEIGYSVSITTTYPTIPSSKLSASPSSPTVSPSSTPPTATAWPTAPSSSATNLSLKQQQKAPTHLVGAFSFLATSYTHVGAHGECCCEGCAMCAMASICVILAGEVTSSKCADRLPTYITLSAHLATVFWEGREGALTQPTLASPYAFRYRLNTTPDGTSLVSTSFKATSLPSGKSRLPFPNASGYTCRSN